MNPESNFLEQLLNIHFLRPETALWRTLDCELFYQATRGMNLSRGLELGCGDGTLSFINAGGRISNFDTFMESQNMDNYKSGADIHDFDPTVNLEMDDEHVRISYDLAVDLKASLIKKALRFSKLYKNGLAQDLNLPLKTDQKFPFVFSNILYWLDDVQEALKRIHSHLETEGRAYIFVPNDNFKELNWLFYKAPHSPPKAHLNFFDRGYASLIHHCYSAEKWMEMINSADLKVEKHTQYMSPEVSNIWNIGTRPIASLLISMANKLSEESRAQIKFEWVDYFMKFFRPLIQEELKGAVNGSTDGCFHFFVLKK